MADPSPFQDVGETALWIARYRAVETERPDALFRDRFADRLAGALKAAGARHIYLAGRAGDREAALRRAGVQSFIYNGCEALSTLTAAYDILG